jgi:hypothetical protein
MFENPRKCNNLEKLNGHLSILDILKMSKMQKAGPAFSKNAKK